MKYYEMRQTQEKELNEFKGIFYAFNKTQFTEGMKKIGLKANEVKMICSFGAGGYILKTRSKAFDEMFAQISTRMATALKDKAFLLDALTYELKNHEFCITYDMSEAFDALGLTIEDIKALSFGIEVLNEASRKAMQCNY